MIVYSGTFEMTPSQKLALRKPKFDKSGIVY